MLQYCIKYQQNNTVVVFRHATTTLQSTVNSVTAKESRDHRSHFPGLETCTIHCVVSSTAWSRSDRLHPQSWSSSICTIVCLIAFKWCSAQLLNLDYEKASSCPLTGTSSSHKNIMIWLLRKKCVKMVANLNNRRRGIA